MLEISFGFENSFPVQGVFPVHLQCKLPIACTLEVIKVNFLQWHIAYNLDFCLAVQMAPRNQKSDNPKSCLKCLKDGLSKLKFSMSQLHSIILEFFTYLSLVRTIFDQL